MSTAAVALGGRHRADLLSLPTDWRLVRVGSNKAPLAGEGWFDRDNYSPDDAASLNGSGPPAWGLKSGPCSGVLVLDLDAEGWQQSFQEVTGHPITDLPQTIAWSSGKPGRSGHAFQVDPDWWPHLRNRRSFTRPWREGDPLGKNGKPEPVTVWELRWDRHQSVIVGAHPETGSYRWLPSRSPQEISDPAPAPDWLLEALLVQELPEAPSVMPSAADADRAVAMLAKIPPTAHSSYDAWLRVGMALHHTDPGLLSAWVDWSRPMTNFDEAECLAKWESFGKGHKGRAATIGTLYYLAKQHGYQEPKRNRERNTPPPPPHPSQEGQAQGQEQEQPAPKTKQQPAEPFSLESYRSDWLPLVMQHVFMANGERWISVENVLHQWTGTHYGPVADLELAPKVAEFLCRLSYVDRKTGEDVHHWARPARVDEAIQWLKRRTAASIEDFNPGNALNLQNGVLSWSWEDRRLVTRLDPHDPAQRFTYCQGYSYDPGASRDTLDRLLQAVEDGEQDTFQRVMGSGLELARYRAIQGRPRAILAIGDGQNGKDTLQGAMSETLGNRGFTHCSIGDFQQYDRGRKFPLAPLYGSRINWSSENTGYARLESIQSLKTAITGERMSYEVKNVQEISYSPNTLLIFNCNDPPRLDASSAAMESRWHVMAFRKRFTSRPDPDKPNELQADPRLKDDHQFIREAVCPAMLNWLLEGLQLAVLEGITYDPDSEALEAVRRQSCHLFDFADDARLVADPDGQVEASFVFELLWNWYQSQRILHVDPSTKRPTWNTHDLGGDHPVKIPRDLAARLRAVFPELRSERGTDKSRRSVLHGVHFVTADITGGGMEAPGGGTAEARAEA
jgi:phage/plasmid-associated DNA primase